MRFNAYPDRDMLTLGLADRLASDLRQMLDQKERVLFVVPGGTTPGPIFDTISAVPMDWSRVRVLLSDERWVPENDPRSNTGLVRKRLLKGQAAQAELVPLYLDDTPAPDAIDQLTSEIAPALPIDVCLLGMGSDMHTASLFPGAPGLSVALETGAPILSVQEPADQPETRITLSAPVLCDAVALHVVITGDEKRAALERAQDLAPQDAPIAAVLDRAEVHWAA